MDNPIRINQYIALCGVTSRRKADELISQKLVKINNAIAENGNMVSDGDIVEIQDSFGRWTKLHPPTELVVYAINKPINYTSTVADKHAEHIVTELVPNNPRVVPVGRLDKASQGLMLLTNNGPLAHAITHPSQHVVKTYDVICQIPYKYSTVKLRQNIQKLAQGILLDGVKTLPAIIKIINHDENTVRMEIQLSEGKNQQIRKMALKIGLNVIQLTRTSIGNLTLKSLALEPGKYKQLSEQEIKRITHV